MLGVDKVRYSFHVGYTFGLNDRRWEDLKLRPLFPVETV